MHGLCPALRLTELRCTCLGYTHLPQLKSIFNDLFKWHEVRGSNCDARDVMLKGFFPAVHVVDVGPDCSAEIWISQKDLKRVYKIHDEAKRSIMRY